LETKPLVDIFIPVISNHAHLLKAALGSAFTQYYEPIRVVLWIEDSHPVLEDVLLKHWYTPNEHPNKRTENDVVIEDCHRGILVRNLKGRTGHAGLARQWLFCWAGKAQYVKMLDSDDILFPSTVSVMMRYMSEGVDGVFCPLIPISEHRVGTLMYCDFAHSACGSGTMLLHRNFMERVIAMGFKWYDSREHDLTFQQFLKDKLDQFTFIYTKETALYLYLKNNVI
jgi:hypothetical protein